MSKRKRARNKLLCILLTVAMLLSMIPVTAMAQTGGDMVMSFEMYDASSGTVTLLKEPTKISFEEGDTGESLAKKLLGEENVAISNGWITSFTFNGIKYTASDAGANGSWSVYENNAEAAVTISNYEPEDGDVYRVILTSYDATTYKFPVMKNNMDGLYWAMSESDKDLEAARDLVESKAPEQASIDSMAAQLSSAGGKHRVLTDGRTIQVDTSGSSYKYMPTLSVDKLTAAAGETVTATVTVPNGMQLKEGSLKANGVTLSATQTENQYMFTMPDCHVTLTAEYEVNDAGKLLGASFSYDENGENKIVLNPAFDKDTNEYELNVYDYDFADGGQIYSTLTFDADKGTTAAWQYYMTYGGYGFYAEGPAAESGKAYGHSYANTVYPGMTNGQKHRVDITPAGGVASTYYFKMTMLPTLTAIEAGGEAIEKFAPNTFDYNMTVADDTETLEIEAAPYEEGYTVAINGENNVKESVKLDDDGVTEVKITVDDDNGVVSEYILTVKTETAVAQEKAMRLSGLNTLMEAISSGYVNNTGEWIIMDMAAYEDYNPDTQNKTTNATKQEYINAAIAALSDENADDTTIDKAIISLTAIGIDPTELYTAEGNEKLNAIERLNSAVKRTGAWTAPYTLIAYNQGEYETDTYEEELVSALLESQQDDGSWNEYGTIDTTANVIAGLSFYKGREDVDKAIEKAVEYLSSKQKESGAFDDGFGENSNSTAMVIIGLTAVGIDPSTDTRFIKNGNSALDGLLTFSVESDGGFGYSDNKNSDAYATEQSFRALIAAAQVIKTEKAYNVYDFSGNSLVPAKVIKGDETDTSVQPPQDANPSKTGDENEMLLWVMIALAGCATAAATEARRRKKAS